MPGNKYSGRATPADLRSEAKDAVLPRRGKTSVPARKQGKTGAKGIIITYPVATLKFLSVKTFACIPLV
ncbi:MAG: hypothetical protein COV71_05945 [Candidatus Omnitrophica bacterium CG11_big_fil_rev_8_21_14_0_20_41_12]|nr:MAG: hypothetical protein COV71_05945 [Candidatus Omnitrophica bacterium CG11_big_fil_rev_8_21_14_0_20_41_12]